MAARRIPKSYRNVTGVISSLKTDDEAEFESTLEQDFYLQLDFLDNVIAFNVQPTIITYYDYSGFKRRYTPDVLVSYSCGRQILYEVKYSSELHEKREELTPKFKAAIAYARAHGFLFKVVTEKKIRTTQFENIKFLRSYSFSQLDEKYADLVEVAVNKHGLLTPEKIVNHFDFGRNERAKLIFSVWQMLATKQIRTDLSIPISMQSELLLGGPYD